MNAREAAEAAGVTYRQATHWIDRGYLGSRGPGSGHEAAMSDSDVERLRVMGELVSSALRVPPAAAARVAEAVVLRGRSAVTVGRWALVRDWSAPSWSTVRAHGPNGAPEVHVRPVADVVAHPVSRSCACGPDVESEDGSWDVVVHHALDGRE